MKTLVAALFVVLGFETVTRAAAEPALPPLRPPAIPLITHDPYFSCWAFGDNLRDNWPMHWTGLNYAFSVILRVDDAAYVLAGRPLPFSGIPQFTQTGVEVLPTRTIFSYTGARLEVTLTFLTPALPHDLKVLSRPVTYVVVTARSTDTQAHAVKMYFDASGEWVVNTPDQPIAWDRLPTEGLTVLRFGSAEQPVLRLSGDNVRIDWGHLMLAAPEKAKSVVAIDDLARVMFVRGGALPPTDDARQPRPARDRWPVLACVQDMGTVKQEPVSAHVMLAYDDDQSIEYMGKPLHGWWRHDHASAADLLATADWEFNKVAKECEEFDARLMADLRAAGGERYARLGALAYRQCLAAHKLVASEDGKTPLLFSKENFSNGCIDTVDVTYPSAPFFLLFNPTLLKGQLTPILDYASSDRWKFPFAPHDLGTYPKANGQVYGGGEKDEKDQMPVEETGNVLIMLAALARVEGNADYANRYWPTLEKWAAYLKDKGLDPENQLCTDDFAGHLAHNTNLSLKAILALRAYADLAGRLQKDPEAATYLATAKEMAAKWQTMASDGDHYKLTFDQPGTWSQKYNLVWDKLLHYDLFPKEVREKELAFYKTKLKAFGLPLDSRKSYTKLDWTLWTATLADNEEDFRAFVAPVYDWVNQTPSRVPLTDWYDTVSGRQQGFQARSVVGGVFVKMLADEGVWQKYATAKPAAAIPGPLPAAP